jgi:hypothetical protein
LEAAVKSLEVARERNAVAINEECAFFAGIEASVNGYVVCGASPAAYASKAANAVADADAVSLEFSNGLFNRVYGIGDGDSCGVADAMASLKIDAGRVLGARKLANDCEYAAKVMEARFPVEETAVPVSPASEPVPPPVTEVILMPTVVVGVHVQKVPPSGMVTLPVCGMDLLCKGVCYPDPLRKMHFVCSSCSKSFQSSYWASKVHTWRPEGTSKYGFVD